jgi:hypothetical protein
MEATVLENGERMGWIAAIGWTEILSHSAGCGLNVSSERQPGAESHYGITHVKSLTAFIAVRLQV